MSHVLAPAPLTAGAFAPYGDVLDTSGTPTAMINNATAARYSDLAQLDFTDGRAGISIFKADAFHLPHMVAMVERHPKGSQAFLPLGVTPFLVVVAQDENGKPVDLRAYLAAKGEGINIHRNIWHGVLTPIGAPATFAVVDRIGEGANLEEHWFDTPYTVTPMP